MNEQQLETQCIRAALMAGYTAEKGAYKGAPDQTFYWNGEPTFRVEFKTPRGTGRVAPHQQVKIDELNAHVIDDARVFFQVLAANWRLRRLG